MSTPHTPSVDQLKRALELSEKIQQLEAELNGILGGQSVKPVAAAAAVAASAPARAKVAKPSRKGAGRISPEALERIAAAQRLRWAKVRAAKGGAAAKPAKAGPKAGGKRVLSPEARERIAAAQRKRWAKARKAK